MLALSPLRFLLADDAGAAARGFFPANRVIGVARSRFRNET
jgi:hypothetical protein